MSRPALLLLAAAVLVSAIAHLWRRPVASSAETAGALPPVMLWAWHGSHELRDLDPERTGVAFLAGTVRLSGDSVALLPGTESIDAPPGTIFLPVVRIEIDPVRRPPLDERQLAAVTAGVLGYDSQPYPGLQLDFDATLSQRRFYTVLLANVRRALGDRLLSVTALPSWCLDDPWLPGASIDEIVPMVYRMGPDAEAVRKRLAAGRDFASDCRRAVGISTDEPLPPLRAGRRLYVFRSRK